MRNYLTLGVLCLLGYEPALAQTAAAPRYMQVFYEGTGWLAGRPLLHYSPSLRGKTDEVVAEPDSTKSVSPGAFTYGKPAKDMVLEAVVTEGSTTVSSGNGQPPVTYMRGQDGKLRPRTSADVQREQAREQAQRTRFFNLLDARATLARNALTAALNAAAADGWEVVQMTHWGEKGGLVYLLRRRLP